MLLCILGLIPVPPNEMKNGNCAHMLKILCYIAFENLVIIFFYRHKLSHREHIISLLRSGEISGD